MTNGKLIVVLGMHRSGSSAIARGLQVLGIDLGDRLVPAIEGVNSKGFWEDFDILGLNIEILNCLGSEWYRLRPLSSDDVDLLRKEGFITRAVELLHQKTVKYPIFGFKDPRVAILLPFWKEVFSHCQLDVSYIVTVRHPRSVVESLAKRDDFDVTMGYLLWLTHVISSITGSIGARRVLVDYDRIMGESERELERIARQLGLMIDASDLQYYKSEFLDERLRHTVYDLSDLSQDALCPPLVNDVYTSLLGLASSDINENGDWLQHAAKNWLGELERLMWLLIMVDRLNGKSDAFRKTVIDQANQIESLNKRVIDQVDQIASLNKTVVDQVDQITTLNRAAAERDIQISSLKQAMTDRECYIDSLSAEINLIKSSKSWRLISRISRLK